MSLLGIDVGSMGCKSTAFSSDGRELASAYREYNFISGQNGYAELNSFEVWQKVKETIKEVTSQIPHDPVTALSTSSMGEAMVPVTREKEILGNSILGNDIRGGEFLNPFIERISPESVYAINGNIANVFYSFPKLAWIKKYNPEIYGKADYFLLWADFVSFMLGAAPVSNYSLSSRTLLFDVHSCRWSDSLLQFADIDPDKLALPHPSGKCIGNVSPEPGKELNLNPGVEIISGGHDQCCAALGCGISEERNEAMYGIGTFVCIVPVYSVIPDLNLMYRSGLNYEHHVIPGRYVSFIFNLSGGALIRWYRHTFGQAGLKMPGNVPVDYDFLFNEISGVPNDIIVIPRFGPTGPPDFLKDTAGTISGLSLQHSRGDILQGMLDGITFYLKDFFSDPEREIFRVDRLIATGGGSKSPKWLQTTADILNMPVVRNRSTEAGTLGAAILAGTGSGEFSSVSEGIKAMVSQEQVYFPDAAKAGFYEKKFEQYKKLYSFLKKPGG